MRNTRGDEGVMETTTIVGLNDLSTGMVVWLFTLSILTFVFLLWIVLWINELYRRVRKLEE